MIDVNHLCPGCMGPWPDPQNPCPRCGFSWGKQPSLGRELPPFTILAGRYLLGAKLGAGGFGITYLAMDLVEEIPVAIKEFFPASLAQRENKQVCPLPGEEGRTFRDAMRAFRREGELMAQFRGMEGVVSQRDFVEENGTSYLVMDYVPGETLMHSMRRTGRVYSQKEALELMRPILRAVDAMHQKHILHRDISPENLILGPDGKLTLIDFGAAREFDLEGEENLTVILKHGYAPEEQYRSGSRQGPWTDLYACCAVLYQMISGIRPQDADQRRRKDQLLPLDEVEGVEVTHGFARALEKGLTVHATERYPSIRALLEDLDTGTDLSSVAPPQPVSPPVTPQEQSDKAPEPISPTEPAQSDQPELSQPTTPPDSEKKKLPWWGKAVAIVAALGLVIFLGQAGGGDTEAVPAALPDIYGNVQADGTTWVRTQQRDYTGQVDPETGLFSWEKSFERSSEWDFGVDQIERAQISFTDVGDELCTTTYDTQGNLLWEQYQDSEKRTEYRYEGETVTAEWYDEEGNLESRNISKYNSAGSYDNDHILHGITEYYDPDTGELTGREEGTYSRNSDGSYEVEYVFESDSETGRAGFTFNSDGLPVEEWQESETPDEGSISNHTSYTYDAEGNCISEIAEYQAYNPKQGKWDNMVETEYSYSFQYDDMGRVLEKVQTAVAVDNRGNSQVSHTQYTYDSYGNELTKLEYTEGNEYASFTTNVYSEYEQTENDRVFVLSGNTSGNIEPEMPEIPEVSAQTEAPESSGGGQNTGFTPSPEYYTGDLEEVVQEVTAFLQENTNLQVDSLSQPQMFESQEQVELALKAGEIDCAVGIFGEDAIPSGSLLALPPQNYQTEDGRFLSVCCNSMDTAWEVSMCLLENGYYEQYEPWGVFLTKMQEGEDHLFCYVTDDKQYQLLPSELQYQLLLPYLVYWNEQTGGEWDLLDDSGRQIANTEHH